MSKAAIGEIAIGVGVAALGVFSGGLGLVLSPAIISFLVGTGASLVLGGLGSIFSSSGSSGGISSASRNPIAPFNVVYGRAKVGGSIVYLEETGDSNKELHMVIVLACHPSLAVDSLLFDNQAVPMQTGGSSVDPTVSYVGRQSYTPTQATVSITSITRVNDVVTVVLDSALPVVDGETLDIHDVSDNTMNGQFPVTRISDSSFTYICGGNASSSASGSVTTMYPDWSNKAYMEVLLGDHTKTFPGLKSASNGRWTARHMLLGRTAVYLRLSYDETVFANGLPGISVMVRGKKDILDVRTGEKGYTENAALCTADYLAHPTWGFRAIYGTEIPTDQLTAAANICDEDVPTAGGSTEPRYTVNGTFALSTKRGEILQNLLTACGGRLTYSGGQYVIRPAAWPGTSLAIGDDTNVGITNMMMNGDGLVVNAYNAVEGRGAYFPQSAGTSEGQFLMALGLLDAAAATGSAAALEMGKLTLSHVLQVLYRGQPIPAEVDRGGNNFAPHWLFNVKSAFRDAVIDYSKTFTFTSGAATIPDLPGAPVHYVFQVCTTDYKLLWDNPYSVLTAGDSYPFTTAYDETTKVTTVTLTGAHSSFSGSLVVIHSTKSGDFIRPGQVFEAWPDWRPLADGEIDSASDVFNWAYRAFTKASDVIGAPWNDAARATKEQTVIAYDVGDSRDWVRPSYTKNPFSDGARFQFHSTDGSGYYDPWDEQFTSLPEPGFSADDAGNVILSIGDESNTVQNPIILAGYNAPGGAHDHETDGSFDGYQYGNASVGDTYNSGDSTTVVLGFLQYRNSQPEWMGNVYWASLVEVAAARVQCYIDTADQTTFDPTKRYSTATFLVDPSNAPFVHATAGEVDLQDLTFNAFAGTSNGDGTFTFTFSRTDFKNSIGDALPAGSDVHTFGVTDLTRLGHRLTIGRVTQLPKRNIMYYPGATPFTANFLGSPKATLIDWRGPVYMGYISPWMWKQTENETGVANSIQMLADSQGQWTIQTGQGDAGPFAPVFYFDRKDDSGIYGTVNTFGWNGPDPNTKWVGYQVRPLAETAELVKACNGTETYYSQAVGIVDTFLDWLDAHWTTAIDGPPTDFPQGPAEINYPEPHAVALIVRAVLSMDEVKRPSGNTSGTMDARYSSLLAKAMAFWSHWYQESGTMAGTFCTDAATQSWFAFWSGELLRTLSQLYGWASGANIADTTMAAKALTWINGLVDFQVANVVDPGAGNSALVLQNAAGAFQWKSKASARDLFNGVKGVYVSPSNNWQRSDFPPYAQDSKHGYSGPAQYFGDANLAQDGGDRRWLDIQLPFTISAATAQRLAKVELMRRRQQGTGTFAFNMYGYQMTALDIIQFSLPLMRWSDKLFEVQSHRFTMNKTDDNSTLLGCEIDLQETDTGVYAWSPTEELTPQGYQQAVLPARDGSATQTDYSSITNTPVISVNGVPIP